MTANAQCPTSAAVITRTHTDITCFGANDGTITVELGDGAAPLNFELYDNVIASFVTFSVTEINDPDGNGNFRKVRYENLYPSSFQVVVFKAGCPFISISGGPLGFVIEEPANLSINVTSIDPDCNPATGGANADGGIQLSISGGRTPYNVTWPVAVTPIAGGVVNSDPANLNLTSLDGGAYTIQVTDASNCVISENISVPISTVPDAGPDQTLCNATSTDLQANPVGPGEIGTWTVVSGTGSFVNINDPNTTVNGLTIGSPSTFRWTVTDAGGLCAGNSDDVIISIDSAPTPADAGGDQTLCATSLSLSANTPVVGSGLWSIVSGDGGTVETPSSPTSVFNGLAGETYVLRWTITNASCPPSEDDVQITFDANPTPAAAGDDLTVCGVNTTLGANAPTSGTGLWTIENGSGGVIANPSSPTSGFSGLAGETYVLRWTISNGTCPPSFDDVQVEFDEAPTVANAGPDRAICGTSHNLEANQAVIGVGQWSIISGTGGSLADPNDQNTEFTGVAGTTYVLRWTISNGACPPSFDDVQIRFDAAPTVAVAGPDETICATSTTLAGNSPVIGTGTWTIQSGAGGSFGSATNPTSSFSGTAGTSYTLRWTISNGVCTDSFDEVIITFDETPTTANAGADQPICGTSTTLAANTPIVGTGIWTIESGTGGSIADNGSATSGFTGTLGSTYVLRWTITNASCPPSFDEVEIRFDEVPTTAVAGPDQTVCSNTVTLAANSPTVGAGSWSVVSGSGGSFANAANPGSGFTGTPGTTYVLRWTITNGSCPASTDDLTIILEETPTVAAAGDDQDVCGLSTSLQGNAPSVGAGNWSIQSGTGGSITDPSNPTSGFSGVSGNTYLLRWTISNGGCPDSFDEVQIIFNEAPTTADAGPDQALCNTATTLAANTAVSGSGLWTIQSGTGGILSDASSAASGFTGDAGTTYVLRWTISNGSCTPSSDEVQISFDATPTPADAGGDQTECGTSVTLAANTPVVGSGVWTIESGSGGSISDASDPSAQFSGVAGSTYTLRWTISNGSCTPSFDEVSVSLQANPTIANAGPDQSLCTTAATLAANTASVGTGMWTIISGTGGSIAVPSSPTSGFTGVAGETYELQWTISNGSCPVSSDIVIIAFGEAPTAAQAGPDQSLCSTNTTLAGNSPTVGTGIWTIVSGTGGDLANPANPASEFSGALNTTYTLRWTITSSCGTSSDDVQIAFFSNPTTAVAGGDKTICGSEQLEGNAPAIGTGVWTIESGTGGNINTPSDPVSSFSGVAGSVYTLRWTITNGACTASFDEVIITIDNNSPTVAAAGADQNICGTTTTLAANSPLVGTGAWSVVSGTGGTFADESDPLTDFTGTAGTTYQLRWTISSTLPGCGSTFDDVIITFEEAPSIASAGDDQSLCQTSTSMQGNAPASGTGSWSVVTGTGGSFADPADPTSTFTGVAGTTYTLRWTITNSCGVSSDDVQIVFEQNPTAASAGSDKTVCGTTNLEGNIPVVGSGLWTITSGIGGVIADATSATSSFSGTAGSVYTLNWTISNGSCPPSVDEVVITIDNDAPTPADAGEDQSVCGLSTTLAANIPGNGTGAWTIISGLGGTLGDASVNNTTFSGSAGVTYVLQWEITSGCGSSSDQVSITLNEAGTIADAGSDRNVCGPTNLQGNSPVVGTGQWSIVSGTGGVLGDPSDPQSSFSGTGSSAYTLRWTISSGACAPSEDDVVITFDIDSPTLANAGSDQSLCATTTTLSGNTPSVGTGTWTIISGTGGVLADPSDPASQFDGNAGATYVLRWTIDSPTVGCASSSDDVSVSFDIAPSVADAGGDIQICGNSTALAANIPASGTGQWSVVNGTGGSFSDVSDPTATFTGTAGVTYTLRWTITTTCGTTEDEVSITLDQVPTTPIAGADRTICGPTTLEGNAAIVGSGQWTIESGTGGVLSDATNPTSGFSGTPGSVYVLRWTISNASCTALFDEVEITIDNDSPTIANAGADQAVCGTSTTLAANSPVVGTGAWSIVSGTGGTLDDDTDPLSAFSGNAGATYVLRWTITSGSVACTPSVDDVIIAFETSPSAANAGADQSVCGNSVTLAATAPVSGAGSWTIISGTGGTVDDAFNAQSSFTGTPGQTYVLRWTVQNSCGTESDDVTVQMQQTPSVANAGADQVICTGINATLSANTPVVGTGIWTVISGAGGAIIAPGSASSQFVGVAGTSYTLRWIITNGSCTPSTDEVVINFAASPTATSPITVCVNNARPVLSSSAVGATGFNWYYYTDVSDPTTKTFLATTATGSFTPGAELDMTVENSVTFEVAAVYGCGESAGTMIVVNVSNSGGCGISGGNCAALTEIPITAIPTTCADPDHGALIFTLGGSYDVTLVNQQFKDDPTHPDAVNITERGSNVSIDPLKANRYFYTIRDLAGNVCVTDYSYTLERETIVRVTSKVINSNVTCHGTSSGSITLGATGSTTGRYFYEYIHNGATFNGEFVIGSPILNIPATDNDYLVIKVDESLSFSCPDTAMVRVQHLFPRIQHGQITSTSVSSCTGADGTITVSNITGGSGRKQIRLLEITGAGSVVVANYADVADAGTPFIFENVGNGAYYVEIRDESGCSIDSSNDPVIIGSPGSVQYTTNILANADCGNNAGRNGVIVISVDPNERSGTYQIGISTSQVIEPEKYFNYIHSQGVSADLQVDTLSRGNYFVFIKPNGSNVCPSVRPVGFIDGPYQIDFDIQRVCGLNDGSASINLVNLSGDPAMPMYNIEVYRVVDPSSKVDDFVAESSNNLITINYVPDGSGEHSWLVSPEQYIVRVYQLNQSYCLGERPPRTPSHQETYTVSTDLVVTVEKIKASLPEPRSTGGFTLKTIAGGLPFRDETGLYYNASILDPASGSEIFGPLKVRRNSQGNYQYEYRNLPIGNYVLQVTDAYGCTLSIMVIVPADTRILIPNIFTPNGDGVNDVFEVVNLPVAGKHQLIISNRWGQEVFSSKNYKEGTFWTAEGAPEGIYFYRLQVEGDQTYNGWVEVMRGSKP